MRRAGPGGLACREVVELLSDYLEGTLPPRTRRRVERHLAACDGCHDYLEQLRETVHTVGRLSEDDLDPAVRDELVDAFHRWRAEVG
jgi:anti-sigma factor RsiW